jgi:hypothetical protein
MPAHDAFFFYITAMLGFDMPSALLCPAPFSTPDVVGGVVTVLTAFYLLTEHFVDASRQQKKRTHELSGPFGPQTTKKRRQAR